jgi:hypothetical protein
MNKSKLPPRLAILGVLVGFTIMALYWYDYKYNPFHLPPPPPVYRFLEKAMFVLCPGLVLQVFTIGTSDRLGWTMWVVAALLNGLIYFLIGSTIVNFMRGRARVPTEK